MTRFRRLAVAALAALLAAALAAPAALAQEEDPRQKISDAMEQAVEKLQAKDYDGALAAFEAILKDVDKAGFEDEVKLRVLQLVHYNTACAYSLKGEKEKALDSFEKALEAGFDDFDHIAEDTDLDPLRELPRFKAIVAKHREMAKAREAEAAERERKELVGQISKEALFPFDFELKTVEGASLKLADFRGKVVLVDVWWTWCPPCRAEMPVIQKMYEEYKGQGFTVLAIDMTFQDDAAAVQPFVEEYRLTFPVLLEPSGATARQYELRSLPTSFFIDRQGVIREVVIGGPMSEALLRTRIETILQP